MRFNSILEAIFYYADAQSDKICLADDKGSVTYSEYAEKIKRLVSWLKARCIKKGDSVVIEADQTIDYLAIELAVHAIAAVFVPLEKNVAATKIESVAKEVDASLIITTKELELDNFSCCIYKQYEEAEDSIEPIAKINFPAVDEISEILFSTGTTGKEKGIVLTHRNDVALAENVMIGVEMEKDNVELIPSPMNHSHGLRRYYANMYNGSTVVLLGSVMDARRFFSNLEEYKVNAIDLVPAALSVLLKLTKDKLKEYATQIRYIQYGAAPLAEADKEKICELLPNTRMYNFYGSTESGCTFIYNFNCSNPKKNCIGKPTHNVTPYLVDENRKPIGAEGQSGCLATQGDMNMMCYFHNEEETARAMENGIVYSSDIAYVDEDGDMILLGRLGDVINVGGKKVAPDEIENAAKQMDCIADCGCVPVPDEVMGQVPKLFVEMKKGQEFNSKEIRSFLAQQLEPFKVPVSIVEIAKIPRSFNGKLLRKELK